MAYTSHKFCCCLPVRLGVFIISSLQLLSAGVVAGVTYYVIAQGLYDVQKYKIIAITTAVVMTLLFVVSLLGLIGAVLHRLALVRLFSKTLNWLFAINVVAGIASIILLFISNRDALIETCINGSTDQGVIDACNNVDIYKYTMIGSIVFNWAVQLYECVIVARYAIQLQEEKEQRWRLSSMKTYTQVSRRDSTDVFNPPAHYPYADKQHSYGSHDAA